MARRERREGPAAPSGTPESPPLVEAVVRQKFLDTAFWTPTIETDGDGVGTVSFPFPDNITDWDVKTAGYTNDVKVGLASASAVVKKNLLARLQAPRFFVERDKVVVSANIHNYLSQSKQVRVELVIDGQQLEFAAVALPHADTYNPVSAIRPCKPSRLAKMTKSRLDWTLQINHAGPTKIKVVAQTDEESDAAEMTFPVLVHGVEKFIAESGVIRNDGTQTVTLDIPAQRRKGATRLDVQLQPSLAATVIDALPYLEDYPYGCLEQTLSRFVPTVLTANALKHAGINLEDLGKRAAVLEEQRANIPPQQVYENSGYTYPKGAPGVLQTAELASRLHYTDRQAQSRALSSTSAVLKQMTTEGLQRLELLQKPNGGFGWWEGSATERRIHDRLRRRQPAQSAAGGRDRQTRPDTECPCLYEGACGAAGRPQPPRLLLLRFNAGGQHGAAFGGLPVRPARPPDAVWTGPAGESLYMNAGAAEPAQVLLRNLITTAKIDPERGTAHWESKDNRYWYWANDKQETTAMVLRALVAILPKEQIVPQNGGQGAQTSLAAQTVRWLVDNRRGSVWTSTRQTANVVEALLEYAQMANELAPAYDATVDVDGKVARTFHITKENALFFDNRFLVGDEILGDGPQKLNITLKGTGTLYYSSYLSYFDLQEPIKGVSNAIGVERKYYKITPKVTLNKNKEYETTNDRALLTDGANLVSGDIVEVELYIKSDNDYDYLVFEDMKPAGCEAVETRKRHGLRRRPVFQLRAARYQSGVLHRPSETGNVAHHLPIKGRNSRQFPRPANECLRLLHPRHPRPLRRMARHHRRRPATKSGQREGKSGRTRK